MADKEIYGTRSLEYSGWHRIDSIVRFVDPETARSMTMIDGDNIEYCPRSFRTLVLLETAQDRGQDKKAAYVMAKLGEEVGAPVYVLLYTVADDPNPADARIRDINRFRVRRAYPRVYPGCDPSDFGWTIFSPDQWAKRLVELREWSSHFLEKRRQPGFILPVPPKPTSFLSFEADYCGPIHSMPPLVAA